MPECSSSSKCHLDASHGRIATHFLLGWVYQVLSPDAVLVLGQAKSGFAVERYSSDGVLFLNVRAERAVVAQRVTAANTIWSMG